MSEAKHTPGPWHARPKFKPSYSDHGYRRIAIVDQGTDSEALCVYAEAANMFEDGRGFCWGSREADASLLAAAPDLLEAVEAIEFALSQGMPAALVLDENSPIRDCLRAALAKATEAQ